MGDCTNCGNRIAADTVHKPGSPGLYNVYSTWDTPLGISKEVKKT